MADPIGISASIIAILQFTGTVVQYINDVKAASQDRQRILNELISASGVLYLLSDLSERPPYGSTWTLTLESLDVPLDQFKEALECLAAKLAPAHSIRKLEKMLTWPFQKAEIQEILNIMERQKSLFMISLCNDHAYVVNLLRYCAFIRCHKLNIHSGISRTIKADVDQVKRGLGQLQIG